LRLYPKRDLKGRSVSDKGEGSSHWLPSSAEVSPLRQCGDCH